ncbi:endo-1,4-beta-xylanase 5 [Colletotrichum spaethianum]|uniref:Beta-xylanase n=1 Tax=Colletotrichum spaethianum TaxID=700344 RepID=A0AA37P8R6_9PEZI|nr:endo-1,4-beta-xylanase 5 [Colletotrichum spaethianum]GKT47735.1 endo-1,4-beta-xylanase 5 [Colletotrichum spaethianum]
MAKISSWLALSIWGVAAASGQGLHELAVNSGKLLFFGTATDTNLFNDAAYMDILNRRGEFGLVVPENSEKWEATEPTEGRFQFNNADMVLGLAQGNQQMFRCHALTWHSQLPQFVSSGTWTPETLTAVIETHIANVVGHFKGACYSWDVVNEALADDGSLRKSVFSRVLGEDFIPISFRAAAAADPDTKLYYNDFSIEFNSKKTDGAVRIAQDLLVAGVRIDGVGLQSHFEVGKTPSRSVLSNVLSRFTDMGLEVALTELDIRHSKVPADNNALQQQAKDYASVVQTCVENAKCVGIVAWEFTDKYSWIPKTFPGTGDACLFDMNMQPKPAYAAVAEVLQNAAATRNGTAQVASIGASGVGTGAGAGTDGGASLSEVQDGAVAAAEVSHSPSASGTGRFDPLSSIAPLLASFALVMCLLVL